MHKFKRPTANSATPDANIDFGAAKARVAHIFEPGDYTVRIEDVRIIGKNQNVLIALDIVETDSGYRVDTRPLWVEGPKSDAGYLAAENQYLIAQLLTLKQLPTSGDVGDLIPKLVGLEFETHLEVAVDGRSGRSYNAIGGVYNVDEAEAI
jgi:hypothetical protein